MKKTVALLLAVAIPFTGCSSISILNRPAKQDLSVLQPGIPRWAVIAKLGNPAYTIYEKDSERVDLFDLRKGISGAAKFVRVTLHLLVDACTAGLWELVATPTEMSLANRKIKVKVTYDSDDNVKSFTDWGEVKIPSAPVHTDYIKP